MRRALVVLVALTACKYAALPPLTGDGGRDGNGGGDGPLPPGSPMIAAVSPALATVGTTVTLDGTFSDPMTVNFPGGVTATATVVGPHRATVVVPTGATSGQLDASTGNVTTNSVFFRTTSFVPGLANFHINYEQPDAARMPSALAAARSGAGAAIVGHNLYIIGGKNGSSYLNTIERALINADGTLGMFTTVTGTTLVTARAGAVTGVFGGYVYVVGGANTSGPLASVERSKIQPDGTLGAFATVSGVMLATARSDAASAIVGDSLYVIGGTGASSKLSSIEAAVIDPDGTLEAFASDSHALGTARAGASAIVLGDSLYVAGGDTGSGITGMIETSTLAPDGTLGAFSAASVSLTTPRAYFSTVVVGSTVFAIGGLTSGSANTASTESATFSASGALGSFATSAASTMTTARHGAATAVARDHVFLVGGNDGTVDIASTEHAGIATHGMLGAFATLAAQPLNGARAEGMSVCLGDHFYFIAGIDITTFTVRTDVEAAIVNPDGSFGPYGTVSGVSTTTARQSASIAVVGNYVYLIGGRDESGASYAGLTSVERAPIDADGNLGTFQIYSASTISGGSSFAAAVIVGNELFIMGGTNGGNQAVTTIEQAQVDTNGSMSAFFNEGGVLKSAVASPMAVVLGGYVYLFGGTDTTGTSTKIVQRSVIQSDNTLASFAYEMNGSTQMLLSIERAAASVAVTGDDVFLVGGADNVGQPADQGLRTVDHATVTQDGTVSSFAIAPSATLSEGVFYHAGVTVGNSVYVIGGGSHTNNNTGKEIKQATLP